MRVILNWAEVETLCQAARATNDPGIMRGIDDILNQRNLNDPSEPIRVTAINHVANEITLEVPSELIVQFNLLLASRAEELVKLVKDTTGGGFAAKAVAIPKWISALEELCAVSTASR